MKSRIPLLCSALMTVTGVALVARDQGPTVTQPALGTRSVQVLSVDELKFKQ